MMPISHRLRLWASAALVLLAGLVAGCEGGDICFDDVSADCDPQYEPTFDNVFTNTLAPSCAKAGACHASGSAAGGLTFETAAGSHALLVGDIDGVARALPNDPACSVLVQRLETGEADLQMPPDGQLPAAERCAIIQWVQNGAKR
jgi:hypothetical protein